MACEDVKAYRSLSSPILETMVIGKYPRLPMLNHKRMSESWLGFACSVMLQSSRSVDTKNHSNYPANSWIPRYAPWSMERERDIMVQVDNIIERYLFGNKNHSMESDSDSDWTFRDFPTWERLQWGSLAPTRKHSRIDLRAMLGGV